MGNLARAFSLVSAAAAGVGFIYLWAYWKRFGINFLEFATLADLIRLSLLPVAGATLFSVVVQVISFSFGNAIREEPAPPNPHPPSKRRFWLGIAFWVSVGAGFLYAYYLAFFDDRPGVLLSIGLGTSIFAAGWFGDSGTNIFKLSVRQTCVVVFLAVYLPMMAYGAGAVRAKAIAEGTASPYRYADTPIWNGGKVLISRDSRYLGSMGNFAFFWTDRKSVLIARWDDIAPLELGREPARKTQPVESEREAEELR